MVVGRRLERLGEQLRRELAGLIRHQVRDPDVGSVIVTGVDVTSDLWLARVYVQSTGTAEEQTRTLAGLTRAAPFLRSTLGKNLHIRRMPELRFMADDSVRAGQRIEEILRDVLPSEAEGEEE
ncbi:MAG: 30S ribosome-binding factor RbfA [Gemmatimonadota bacterium]|nr:30S ribosome-binding factor RbfA [Gemmatimonadota bacterium]